MYSKEERETIILSNDEDRFWDVYSRQTRIFNKMSKLGVEPYKTEMEDGVMIAAYYKLDLNQVSFRKKVVLTEEQREKRKLNMLNNRKVVE